MLSLIILKYGGKKHLSLNETKEKEIGLKFSKTFSCFSLINFELIISLFLFFRINYNVQITEFEIIRVPAFINRYKYRFERG